MYYCYYFYSKTVSDVCVRSLKCGGDRLFIHRKYVRRLLLSSPLALHSAVCMIIIYP